MAAMREVLAPQANDKLSSDNGSRSYIYLFNAQHWAKINYSRQFQNN